MCTLLSVFSDYSALNENKKIIILISFLIWRSDYALGVAKQLSQHFANYVYSCTSLEDEVKTKSGDMSS